MEVRVLPGPPRILSNRGLSGLRDKCRDGAAFSARLSRDIGDRDASSPYWRSVSGGQTFCSWREIDWMDGINRTADLNLFPAANRPPLERQSKRLVLQRPSDWRVTQAGDADTTREATFNSGAHECRRQERERDDHVDLPRVHCSRSAICSTDGAEPVTISLSHRRPCAIAATSLARVSARIGRLSARGVVPAW